MKIVGYKQPQTPAAQKAADKPKDGGNKLQDNKPNGNKPRGGNKPNSADKDAKQDGGNKPADGAK